MNCSVGDKGVFLIKVLTVTMYLKARVLNMSQSITVASLWVAWWGCSVPNSSSGLIFVKIRAESGRIFSENPGKNLGLT